MISLWRQSRTVLASYSRASVSRLPTATMSLPVITTAPSRMMRRSASTVMTVPPDSIRSALIATAGCPSVQAPAGCFHACQPSSNSIKEFELCLFVIDRGVRDRQPEAPAFVTVVEFGSFTKAADALHITQPALSRQVKQLEEELGVELLLREGRGIRITDAARPCCSMPAPSRAISSACARTCRRAAASRLAASCSAFPPTLADTLVPRLVEATRHKFPLVTLKARG